MRAQAAGPGTLERVRQHLVGLRMPRALEVLDHTVQQLERGEIGAVEAIDPPRLSWTAYATRSALCSAWTGVR